jgi:hypothetical protein
MPIGFRSRRQLKDWRDFAKEIVVIVVGVLIALAATHVAEEWNWSRRVDDAERQLAIDAADTFAIAAEAVASGPCLLAQLEQLRDRILASGDVLVPAPLHPGGALADFVFRAPSRPVGSTVWRALTDDGTVAHIDDWRRLRYAELDSLVDMNARLTAETDRFVGRFGVLGFPLALEPSTRLSLVEMAEEQRHRSRLHALVALQVMAAIRDLGNQPSGAHVERSVLSQSGTLAFCAQQGLPVADWQAELDKLPRLERP